MVTAQSVRYRKSNATKSKGKKKNGKIYSVEAVRTQYIEINGTIEDTKELTLTHTHPDLDLASR